MTNDELRQGLAQLTDHQIKDIVFNHFAPVAERVVPTAGRDPYMIALIDYVDRRGDAERVRLADIISIYNPGHTPFQTTTNGKQVAQGMSYSADNLLQTVAKLEVQVSMMARTLEDTQQRLAKVNDALALMSKFDIEDWVKIGVTVVTVKDAVESLSQQVRTLLAVFVAGTFLTLVVFGLLVARYVG